MISVNEVKSICEIGIQTQVEQGLVVVVLPDICILLIIDKVRY
jgi:hypothetical protein